jgi:hypothetical protein
MVETPLREHQLDPLEEHHESPDGHGQWGQIPPRSTQLEDGRLHGGVVAVVYSPDQLADLTDQPGPMGGLAAARLRVRGAISCGHSERPFSGLRNGTLVTRFDAYLVVPVRLARFHVVVHLLVRPGIRLVAIGLVVVRGGIAPFGPAQHGPARRPRARRVHGNQP